jgi:GT2 family glycosyltransferase
MHVGSTMVVAFELTWRDDAAEWRANPSTPLGDAAFGAAPLARGAAYVFSFMATAAHLDGLWLRLGNCGNGASKAYVDVALLSADRQVLKRGRIWARTINRDCMAKALDLGDLAFELGAVYQVEVRAPAQQARGELELFQLAMPDGRWEQRSQLVSFRSDRVFSFPSRGEIDPQPKLVCVAGGALSSVARIAHAARAMSRRFSQSTFTLMDQGEVIQQWPKLRDADMVVFVDCDDVQPGKLGFDAVCFALHRIGVATLYLDTTAIDRGRIHLAGDAQKQMAARQGLRKRCHFALLETGETARLLDNQTDQDIQLDLQEGAALSGQGIEALRQRVRAVRLPRVAIVSVLYRKADIIETFLDHIVAQTYPGEIQTVLINDCSPDEDADRARRYARRIEMERVPLRKIIVQDNAENLGNCGSRLAGLAAVDADIFVVIDCDCLINRDFIAAHVFEHAFASVDVVIGPLNIESIDRPAALLVRDLENNPADIQLEAEPQDPITPHGFLNCITRNFSVKSAWVRREPIFDLDFSYSAKPGSGFGWEDVEMGWRLYAAGAGIRYTPHAFAVHCSHASSASEAAKVKGSARNFARLFEKHPDLALAGRRWAIETAGRITRWAAGAGVDLGGDGQAINSLFKADGDRLEPFLAGYRPGARRLKILSYRWHVPHQYELYKLPHDFTLAQVGPDLSGFWSARCATMCASRAWKIWPAKSSIWLFSTLTSMCWRRSSPTALFQLFGAIRFAHSWLGRKRRKSRSATARLVLKVSMD